MRFTTASVILALAKLTLSQGLGTELKDALKDRPETTLFQVLLGASDTIITDVVGDKTTGLTFLVPDDTAITDFMTLNNITDVSGFQGDALKTVFKYHVLVSGVSQTDYASKLGLVVPTLLKDEKFNNRTAGGALTAQFGDDATGQVLYFSKDTIPMVGKRATDDLKNAIVNVRAGLEQTAKMTVVDGTWGAGNSNKYQVVDKVLIPPQPCSVTIQNPQKADASSKLKALDDALVKTQLYPALDTSKNVTCLAPSTDAFKAAGDPQETLDNTNLTQALLFHTLAEVTYTSYLKDGQEIKTVNNATIKVTIDGSDIYFNNAKVIEPNVLTNNGLIHVLDAIMMPDGKPNITSSGGSSSTSGGNAPKETDDEKDAATTLRSGAGVAVAVLAALAIF